MRNIVWNLLKKLINQNLMSDLERACLKWQCLIAWFLRRISRHSVVSINNRFEFGLCTWLLQFFLLLSGWWMLYVCLCGFFIFFFSKNVSHHFPNWGLFLLYNQDYLLLREREKPPRRDAGPRVCIQIFWFNSWLCHQFSQRSNHLRCRSAPYSY